MSAADLGTAPAPRPAPLREDELAALFSRLSATARWRAARCEALAQGRGADHWSHIRRMADVLLCVEGLAVRDYVAERGDEDTYLRTLVDELPRVRGSIGGGRARRERRADEIASIAIEDIRDAALALLGRVA